MGRRGAGGVLALAAALCLAASIGPASIARAAAGPGQDAHYFLMTAHLSGEYLVDYGKDMRPGGGTQAGIDGTEAGSWSVRIRAVGRAVGDGPLRSAAAEAKGTAEYTADLFSYTVQMGEPDVDPLCEEESPGTLLTRRSPVFGRWSTRPQWIARPKSEIAFGSGGFEIGFYPLGLTPARWGCLHGAPQGLDLHTIVDPEDASVGRGAFNPRSDRSFSKSWSDPPVNLSREEHGDHSETGSAQLSISVKAVSERKARKKRDRYRKKDPDPGVYAPPSQ